MSNYNPVINFQEGNNNSGITGYDRLLTTRLTRGYVLEAAESVEIADPTRIIFVLKPNLVYQDIAPVSGRAVVAQDIAATQEYVKVLPNAEQASFQRGFIDRMEAPDDRTIIFQLSRPSAYLFGNVQFGSGTAQLIIPEEMLAILDDTPPIGSGPYQLADHTFNASYTWRRFENYHGAAQGLPYIDERVITQITDQVALETAFRGEQIHQWSAPSPSIDRLEGELDLEKFIHHQMLTTSQYKLEFNCNPAYNKPYTDVRVREAIYRLTDRHQFLNLIYDGRGVVPPGPIAAVLEDYQLTEAETEEFFVQDVDEARKLLEAANFPFDQEQQAVLSTSGVNPQAAEVWQQQLARAGFQMRINAVPFAEWLRNAGEGTWDLGAMGGLGTDTPVRFMRKFHSDPQEQVRDMGLFDPEIDAMIERSEAEVDRDENIRLVKELQLAVLERYGGFLNAVTPFASYFVNAKLQNWEMDPTIPTMYRAEAWLDES